MKAVAIIFLFFALAFSDDSVVQTQYGPVQGLVGINYRAFKNIPYIAPPVGSLRWADPVPPNPWTNPINATGFGPGCPQLCELPPHTCPESQSEDCISLNVYTPIGSGPFPVMVFLPGGHFEQGASGCLLYDGTTIVQQQVVLVTVNYRLGFLGWLTTAGVPGNFGFKDQIMALKWVQANIANFGGNPKQVTLFGQSAGATSIRAHLVSPLSAGLFHQAIMESDPVSLPMKNVDDATETGNSFANHLGCSPLDINCFRSKSINDIIIAQNITMKEINIAKPIEAFYPLVPTVDGNVVPNHIWEALETGNFNRVPIIIGDVSQDALLFVYKAFKSFLNTLEYEAVVSTIFLDDSLAVTEQYPPKPLIGDKRPQLSILGTDYIFECAARQVENLIYKTSSSNSVYLYQFDHALLQDIWGPLFPFCVGKVCHGSELPFVFDPPALSQFVNFTAPEKQLSQSVIGYWTNFAHTGNPNNGPYTPQVIWPTWDPVGLQSLHFQTPQNNIVKALNQQNCNFWDGLGYEHGW